MKDLLTSFISFSFALLITYFLSIQSNYGSILYELVFLIYLIHFISYIPSFLFKTEKFYDITGTVAYLFGIYFIYNSLIDKDIKQTSIIVLFMVFIWALRLGIFLFYRVFKFKNDTRFDKVKKSASKFLMYFMVSSLWVFLTTVNAFVYVLNNNSDFDFFFYFGSIIWLIGFFIEVTADLQKFKFKLIDENKNKFINSGLWSFSRHPNYFGEILLWIGIAVISIPSLISFQYISLISPIFVYFLLTKASGIPILEESANKKWGNDEDYINYKNETPILFPNFLNQKK